MIFCKTGKYLPIVRHLITIIYKTIPVVKKKKQKQLLTLIQFSEKGLPIDLN